jgi:hypothetical protein
LDRSQTDSSPSFHAYGAPRTDRGWDRVGILLMIGCFQASIVLRYDQSLRAISRPAPCARARAPSLACLGVHCTQCGPERQFRCSRSPTHCGARNTGSPINEDSTTDSLVAPASRSLGSILVIEHSPTSLRNYSVGGAVVTALRAGVAGVDGLTNRAGVGLCSMGRVVPSVILFIHATLNSWSRAWFRAEGCRYPQTSHEPEESWKIPGGLHSSQGAWSASSGIFR